MTENEIDAIRKRLEDCPIPENAQADWQGTNHYEIHDPTSNEFWWLEVYDVDEVDSSTEQGKRVGAVLDYACAYRRDVGALLGCITELEAALEVARKPPNIDDPEEIEQFQKFWGTVVDAHQDNRLSIGDAYRLKDLLYRDRFRLGQWLRAASGAAGEKS